MILDNEKLILLIKQNDVLYNKDNALFKYPEKKREVWQEIAEEMEASEKACKRRWIRLRDRYLLECCRMKIEKGYTSSWAFMELMRFLKPHITSMLERQYLYDMAFEPTIRNKRRFFGILDFKDDDADYNQSFIGSPQRTKRDDGSASLFAFKRKGYLQYTQPKKDDKMPMSNKPTLRETLEDIRNDPTLPEMPTLRKTLVQLSNEHKENEKINPSIYAFGEMIVSMIFSMSPRNRIRAMQQATDIVMKIKLEE